LVLGKVLGGSGSINSLAWARGNRADYDAWAEAGNAGWDFHSVLPLFKKAEDWEDGASEFRGAGGPSLQALILGSGEYFTRIAGGTVDGFLQALYGDVLHRAPDAAGLQGWGELLEDEDATPTDIAAAVMNSLESDIDEVQGLYQRFLHRGADSLGLLTFTSALQHGVTNEVATMVMLGSAEYFQNT
jgi:choline dehydrogenase-like flavoprotein